MSVSWVCRLPPFPLWLLVSNSIYSWRWVRVRILWHLDGTRKSSFACILPLAMVGCPIFPVSWFFHCLGMVTKSNNLLRQTSSIDPPKSAMGNLLGPLFVKSLGPSRWPKNSLISSNTFQLMWAHLICMNFDFNALSEGCFSILHIFNNWSYRGYKYLNNTHKNAANVANIYFNSYLFIGGCLGSAFFIFSSPDWFLVPWDSADASPLKISSSVYYVFLGINVNGKIPIFSLSYIATRPPGLNLV